MENIVIRFSDLTAAYNGKVVLDGISMEIREGEFIGVIGPNGSGKTTLIKTILGLIKPIKGSVNIFNCSCESLRCYHLAKIGYLPQKESIDPNFPITCLEAVLMGRYSGLGLFKRPTKKDWEIVESLLEDVGMYGYRDRPLGQLSGGEHQRVMIARALAGEPEVLLLDEPTTGIDTATQHSILNLIRGLHKNLHLTILLITHDINMISPFVDRLALLKTKLVAMGPPSSVLTREILSLVYGKEVIVMGKDEGSYVIVGDHHHV